MTTIMNQVTCSLCSMKIDELKWKEHLFSTNHLQLCKDNKDKKAKKFFEMIFNACRKKNKIYKLKKEKHMNSGSFTSQQNYQKKI